MVKSSLSRQEGCCTLPEHSTSPLDCTPTVYLEEPRQDVVFVGAHHQFSNGQTHALRVVARQNVAKVARRDREMHGLAFLRGGLLLHHLSLCKGEVGERRKGGKVLEG